MLTRKYMMDNKTAIVKIIGNWGLGYCLNMTPAISALKEKLGSEYVFHLYCENPELLKPKGGKSNE